jgi:glycosyltransferase involved in cell wall biosynthesis
VYGDEQHDVGDGIGNRPTRGTSARPNGLSPTIALVNGSGSWERAVPSYGTQNPLRILLVAARYVPYAGGVETHTYEVARRVAALGADVTVLSTDPGGRFPTEERDGDVRILRVRAWPRKRDYYFAPGIYSTILAGTWDVIHCQGYHTLVAPLAMLAARRARTPYVLTLHSGGHSSRLRKSMRGMQWTVLRPLIARAERVVAVSTFEREFFRDRLRLPEEKFTVISNGSHLPRADSPAAPEVGPLIVSLGRLERYKGHHRVIAAMPRVLERYPTARLRIIGAGPVVADLRRLVTRLGIESHVEIGPIDPADRTGMARALSHAAVVTLLSEYESQGIAALEALALGRPVLVAYTSALRELADQGLARPIALNASAGHIAEAILDLVAQPPPIPPVDLPTWDKCATELFSVYRSITRQCHASALTRPVRRTHT